MKQLNDLHHYIKKLNNSLAKSFVELALQRLLETIRSLVLGHLSSLCRSLTTSLSVAFSGSLARLFTLFILALYLRIGTFPEVGSGL